MYIIVFQLYTYHNNIRFSFISLLFSFEVEVEAGAIITENNTYFKSSGKETSGTKEVRVCPGDNICQVNSTFYYCVQDKYFSNYPQYVSSFSL